ncbi:MAG: DUF2092 domain-containing protein [Planctomycetia bacterium]|nr:DUF2092 domain-containing protein [Planctomycetia bacterium]
MFADDVLRATLTEGEAGCPLQLPLLLADDTIDLVLGDATAATRIAGLDRIEGRPCARLEVPKPDGLLQLWVDRDARVLRRMKVPTDSYAALLSRQSGTPTQVSVVVEFTGAALNADVPAEAFAFQVPDGAARVTRLEPLRAPAALSPLLGRPPDRFLLTDLGGKTVSPDALQGRPAVLEFFFEIVRDADGLVAQALVDNSFPATVILAADGSVADVIRGEHGEIAADVAESLAALAANRPTTQLVRARHDARLRDYRQRLARAAGDGSSQRLPEQVIAPHRQPVRFKLRRAWRAAEVSLPGNVVCLDPARGCAVTRVVALDGWRRVVELDATGSVVGRPAP